MIIFASFVFFQLSLCYGNNVMIILNEENKLFTTNEWFLSLGMDSNLIRDHWETFSFTSVRLKTLAKGLSPAFLRLMGTDGDRMIFVRNTSAIYVNSYPFPSTKFNFTETDWNNINQ